MNENIVDEDKLMAAVEFSCVALERKPSNTSSRGRYSGPNEWELVDT
jgi:hypothetical protein